jgi:hypothetical protein
MQTPLRATTAARQPSSLRKEGSSSILSEKASTKLKASTKVSSSRTEARLIRADSKISKEPLLFLSPSKIS